MEELNKSSFPVVELKLYGRQFEVGDKANKVRVKTLSLIIKKRLNLSPAS
jgi:hypothetical protein